LLGGLVTLVVSLRVIAEERLLRTRYQDYGAYAQSTKAVIPFIV
jgi:protein-S-isoprenylcysteine O-methyltransferase Ste14